MSHVPPRGAVPWRNRTVQVVLVSTMLAPLGVPLVAPALPVVRDAFGLTDAQASLLVSAYFVVGILVSPFVGLLADRVGRKRVLVPALVVFSLTGLAGFFAPTYTTLLVLRGVQGTAAAALFVTTVTIIGDVFDGVHRNAVLGANVAVLSLGAAAFPVLGGALAAVAWNAPFVAYALGLPVALFASVVLEEPTATARETAGATDGGTDGPDGGTAGYLRGAVSTLTPALGGLLATAFLTEFLLFGTVVTTLPFLLTAAFGVTPLYVGLMLMAAEGGSVVAAAASGRLAGVFSNGRLVALGFTCYGLSLAGVYVSPSPAFVAVSVLVFGVGLGLSMPAVDAAVSERVAQEYRAGLLGLRNSTTFLGRATGPVAFAAAATVVGYRPLLGVAAAGVLVVAVVAAMLTRASVSYGDPEPTV
ncbi:MFS transporter [Haloarchaeobius sp. HRN-SO-5]|uniref:MFS transporter n=1 Tax=Haloarchaeobius sp. HRN-SO-5 TaxID=3446118 RepID=UPI003EBF8081